MARMRALVLGKTGTPTHGRARLTGIRTAPGYAEDDVLRLAASLDQASKHAIAQTITEAARQRGLGLSGPVDVNETPGEGIEGDVGGRHVVVGSWRFVTTRVAGNPAWQDSNKPAGAVT
jgi:cation transport ATPase